MRRCYASGMAARAPYAAITPYYREDPPMLERCIASVQAQTLPVDHILIADGHPQDWIDRAGVRHIRLDRSHSNFGNTPRGVGAMLVIGGDYDAVTMLDADNFVEPNHFEHCVACAAPKSGLAYDVVAARRRFVRLDGTAMPVRDEPLTVHADTSCFFILKSAFYTLPVWGTMPRPVSPICDRIFYQHVKQQVRLQNIRWVQGDEITVNYLCTWQSMYLAIGEVPPPFAKPNVDAMAIRRWWNALSATELNRLSRMTGFKLERLFR
jgi:hypothetical protein